MGGRTVTTNSSYLAETLTTLQTNPKDLAEALGCTAAAISRWLKVGTMPKYIQVACEGLLRRQKRSRLALLIGQGDALETCFPVARALKIRVVELGDV